MRFFWSRLPWWQLGQVIVVAAFLSVYFLNLTPNLSNQGHQLIVTSHPIFPSGQFYTFPDGGRTLMPDYRLIALYGTPNDPVLGALGQQSLAATIARVKALAAQYQPLISEHVLPTLEIIATVAASFPTSNNSYSYPINQQLLTTWVETAQQSGVYVVLDLQPGRDSFLSQAQQLKPLLEHPNVGLALDPEWRLGSNQLPLQQIGSVSISEVNATASWLASLTKQFNLPQKIFLLHEFKVSMIPDRNQLKTTDPELDYVIQMDGQGTQLQKLSTWNAILIDPPANVYFGWKNFYQKDPQLLSPAETMQILPKPWYVSYQ